MLQNHLFWMAVALFFLSTVNLNVYFEYRKSHTLLSYFIGGVGLFGIIGGIVRLVSLSMTFNWWWFFGISAVSLIIIGLFALFSRIKIRLLVGTLNILIIPMVWWCGSKFNSVLTFDWFYDMIDAVQAFFS